MNIEFESDVELENKLKFHIKNGYTFIYPVLRHAFLGKFIGVTLGKVGCFSLDDKKKVIYYTILASDFGRITVGIPKDLIDRDFRNPFAHEVVFEIFRKDEIDYAVVRNAHVFSVDENSINYYKKEIYKNISEDLKRLNNSRNRSKEEKLAYLKHVSSLNLTGIDINKKYLKELEEYESEREISSIESKRVYSIKNDYSKPVKQDKIILKEPIANYKLKHEKNLNISNTNCDKSKKSLKINKKEKLGLYSILGVIFKAFAFLGFTALCFIFAAELDIIRVVIFWLVIILFFLLIFVMGARNIWQNRRK